MKTLIINTSDDNGGAHIGSYRIFKGLRTIGVDAQMYVQHKTRSDPAIIADTSKIEKFLSFVRPFIDDYPITRYKNRANTLVSPAWVPNSVAGKIIRFDPDIIHLNWICQGFISVSEIKKFRKPIVWTMHDMWPFTGGCHYADQCRKYEQRCGACPQLGSEKNNDLSSRVWSRKKRYWKDLDLTIVSPSRWIADCAKKSSLFKNRKIVIIPYGLDLDRYKPIDKTIARSLLKIPLKKKILLFGAVSATSDTRKGFRYLLGALDHLSHNREFDDAEAVVFGSEKPENEIKTGMNVNYLGNLTGDLALSLVYSAADVFIAPSLQENFGLTILESIACGTPVVAFDVGGIPDMIDHKKNGYLAKPRDSKDLAEGISWVLSDEKQWKSLSENCRSKAVGNFEISSVARQYADLYRGLLDKT
jgi:glycosyltransferase involved in cell wall biosynthesis